jgi:flagellar export protein FliJ
MPYQSKLAAVLFQRKRNEEEASRVFLTSKNILISEQEQLHLLDNKLQATLDDLTEKQAGGSTSYEMALYFRFIEMFRGRVEAQRKAVFNQEHVCEAKRALLEISVKERKAVEIIEEKRKNEYLKAAAKKEQAVLDEIGGQLRLRHHA